MKTKTYRMYMGTYLAFRALVPMLKDETMASYFDRVKDELERGLLK